MVRSKTRRTLGKTLKIYRARPFSRRDFFQWFLPGLLLPLGFVAYGLWRQYLGYARFGTAPGESWGRPWFLLAALSLIPLILYMLRHLRRQRSGVSFNQNGLRLLGLPGGPQHLFWTQIAGIAANHQRFHLFGLTLSEQHSALIFPTQGRAISLPGSLQDLPDLIEQVKQRVYPLLLPELKGRLQVGQWLHFGPVRLNKSQIYLKNRDFPWQQVKDIRVAGGTLQVQSEQNRQIRIACSRIPNLDLLLRIIENEISVPV
jgi:hypothetical protein